MSVPFLTDSPVRRDAPADFSDKTEGLFISLKNFVDDFNLNALELMGMSLDASVLLSLLNFKGEWSTLTGSANIPYTVSYNNRFWVLLENASDVTTIEPSKDSSFWVDVNDFIPSLRNNNTDEDITLNNNDSYIQVFNPSTPDLIVSLDDATQFNKGFLFQIMNQGDYALVIERYNGDLIGYVEAGKTCYLFLTDNSTSNGAWFTAIQN